jgi:hypothetical protein
MLPWLSALLLFTLRCLLRCWALHLYGHSRTWQNAREHYGSTWVGSRHVYLTGASTFTESQSR